MIIVRGYLKSEYGKRLVTLTWDNGMLSGDERVVYAAKIIARNNEGRTLFVDTEVYDWLSNPITFGGIVSTLFDESGLEIIGIEQMAPPPCPEDFVC